MLITLIIYFTACFINGIIAGFICDLNEIYSFKQKLKEYNLLFPSFKITIPSKLKDIRKLKSNFEDNTSYWEIFRFTHPITNMPMKYGEGRERKNNLNDKKEKHTD